MRVLCLAVALVCPLFISSCVSTKAVPSGGEAELSFAGGETTLNVPGIGRYTYP